VRTILILEQHQPAVGAQSRLATRVLQEHQGQQAERLGFVGHQHRKQLREADRLVAEVCTDGPGSGARGIPLVEHEVEDGEHGTQAFRQQVVRGDAEGDSGATDLPLRSHEPLCQGRREDERQSVVPN